MTDTCVACQNSTQCQNRPGSRDLCIMGTCHACDTSTSAGCGAQVCNAQEQCVACTVDNDCATHQNGHVCSGGTCVECGADADCAGELCQAHICVACGGDAECVTAGIGMHCTNGLCQP
jgi:hypothetical protein